MKKIIASLGALALVAAAVPASAATISNVSDSFAGIFKFKSTNTGVLNTNLLTSNTVAGSASNTGANVVSCGDECDTVGIASGNATSATGVETVGNTTISEVDLSGAGESEEDSNTIDEVDDSAAVITDVETSTDAVVNTNAASENTFAGSASNAGGNVAAAADDGSNIVVVSGGASATTVVGKLLNSVLSSVIR